MLFFLEIVKAEPHLFHYFHIEALLSVLHKQGGVTDPLCLSYLIEQADFAASQMPHGLRVLHHIGEVRQVSEVLVPLPLIFSLAIPSTFLRVLKIAPFLHHLISKSNKYKRSSFTYIIIQNMPRIDLTLRNATRIPLLGVKTQPSPYVIIECEQMSYTSPIAKISQNPIWKYHAVIEAKKVTSFLYFYIYNNNPNAVDELLAFGKVEFGELMTRTNSEYKLRLRNSLEEPINSYLYIQHYDANPADLYLPLDDRTCIKLRLINDLPQNSYFICEYRESSFNLSGELNQNAFRYSPKYDRIRCILKGSSRDSAISDMQTEILIGNIGTNNCFALRFYGPRQQYTVFVSASIILNGLLPENYNILTAKLGQIQKSNGKKNSNYQVKLIGPLNENVFNEKGESEIYVQNNSLVVIEYFQQTEKMEGIEPFCSFKVPLNSLNWQSLQCSHQLKYFDSFKNIQTILNLTLSIKKTTEFSRIVPKLNNTELLFDENSDMQLEQIKLQNCFLFEIIRNNQVQLFHVSPRGEVTAFSKFTVADTKTEYVIQTRETLKQGGKGVFYLVNLDQPFDEKITTGSIQDSLIFKINVDQPNKIDEANVDFSSKFLAFAKKVSVVNICKRFNQMVHDNLLKLKAKSRFTGIIKKGILRLINVKCTGSFGKIAVSVSTDSVYKHMVGQMGNYLLQKSYNFYVSEGSIKIKAKIETFDDTLTKNTGEKGQKFVEVCLYGNFCDFFGTPTPSKYYSQQLKLSPIHKLQLIYCFEQGQKLQTLPLTKLNDLVFFDSKDSISFNLKRAFLSLNNQSYKFRISRGNYTYETHSYRCNNSKMYFQSSERCTMRMADGEQANPIFISAYSHDQEGKLMIYNGFINVKDIVGKGQYQVQLVYEKEEKRKVIYFIMEVPYSCDYLGKESSAVVKLNKISTNTFTSLFRTIYKHYLLVKVNGYQYDIFQCAISQQSLTFNAVINIRKSDFMTFELYSSYKAISKQLFNTSEKQLIGSGEAIWQQIQESGNFVLNYSPKKQSQLKYTKNTLAIQQKSYKLHVGYSTQKAKLQARISGRRQKVSTTQIDVLNKGVVNLQLKELFMLQHQSKIISIQLKPLGLTLTSQSASKISKSYIIKAENMEFLLEATITSKQGQKYRKVYATSKVKLRGNHYKINQPTAIIIYFQAYFYLTANFTVYHNKFVSSAQGDMMIKQVGTRGVKVEKFQIAFARQITSDDDLNVILKRQGAQIKKCDILLKTDNEMNGLVCSLQGKGFKSKERICLSELNLDQLQSQFVYERQLLVAGESLIITFILSYNSIKQVKQQDMAIKYELQKEKSVTIQYSLSQYNALKEGRTPSQIPKKNQGFLVKLTVPIDLANNTKQVHIFPDLGDTLKLSPSVSKNEEYLYYSPKLLSIKTIKLINSQYIDRPVQPLGNQLGSWKYMLDQNPKLICLVTQTPCSISSIGNENWTFRFNFHRLINATKTRLLSVKNTPNDEILTKQLALAVKHGKQCHFIRNLDEYGVTKEAELKSLEFGYDNSCNILQIFLLIDNYFNRLDSSFQKLSQNWMELFPISYTTINLSNVKPDIPFGCELSPLPNHSLNLQKAINKMVVRSEEITCLCDVTFCRKSWGFLSLKLLSCTPIILSGKEKQQIYLYFKVEVQDNNREVVASFNTEARPAGRAQDLEFTNNSIEFLLIQQTNESHYSIKLTGFVLDKSNNYSFMEKKQDITDMLQKRGKQELNIQIKSSETNNLCKNTFQLTLQLRNGTSPPQRQNLIEKAKSINMVDALSFREIDSNEFFERLLGCQQLSHFNQCLEQIKQSYIYREDAQYSSFVFLIQYLSFGFDAHLIGEICEIVHLNLLKCPQIIGELEEEGITKMLYDYFKLICQRERAKVPSKVIKITSEEYMQAISKFKESRTVSNLMQVVAKQAYMLYTPQQMLTTLSSKNNEIILNIINLLLKNSKQMKESLAKDLDEWIEMFGFTTENSEFELFLLVLKNSLLYGSQMGEKSLRHLIDILMQRVYGLSIVYDFWMQITDKEEQLAIYKSILEKYQKKFQENAVETCRGVKMMLSHLSDPKNLELTEKLNKIHSPTLNILFSNFKKSSDIQLLSPHLDLLTFLFQQNLLPQPLRNEIPQLIKQKTAATKDNNCKLILSNYSNKFKGKTVKLISNNKNPNLADQMANKVGFYKKYLITSD